MQNSTHTSNSSRNPKYQLLDNLIKECYLRNVNHSRVISSPAEYNPNGVFCPRTFDGFACWDETPAAATAVQPCPEFVIGFDSRRLAFKRCTENGTWFTHPEANKPWTNYTTCIDVDDLDFRNLVNNIYVGGYSVSLAALLLSLIVFIWFRSLQCTRNRIHMHLFAAFAFNNMLWILWYRAVVNRPEVVQKNQEWCQILHVIMHYFMVCSYIWMFCEGLHLHIALVVVFVKNEEAMRWFIMLGWGLPLALVTVYSTVRYNTPGATERCWMEHSDTLWIIIVPVVMSLITSFVFLVNVVRVLLMKLHAAPNQPSALAAKKATRAALILVTFDMTVLATLPIPLFGLHFVLIPLRPSADSPFEKIYQIFSAILTSLQGLCVAVLFCFTNHDVMMATRTHFARIFRADDAIIMTGMSGILL